MKFGIPIGLIVLGFLIAFKAYEAIRIDKDIQMVQNIFRPMSEIGSSLNGSEGVFVVGGVFLMLIGITLLIVNLVRNK